VLPSLSHQIAADLRALESTTRLRTCSTITGASRVHVTFEGRPVISFSSNDYLGLACDPRLPRAASHAAANSGFGASASRLLAGNHPEHTTLENALATFLAHPAVLLFPTGYQANLGVLTALAGPDDLIVADRAVHASLLDSFRLSRAKVAIYPHLDVQVAERHLKRLGPNKRRRFLVTESLFSMDGDVAPLGSLATIASTHDAALIVDEAHAFGALGPSGRGLCAQFGIQPDVLIGTLGKTLGAGGAFVAGTTDLRAFLINHARSFLFTTGLPVPVAAAAHAALQILSSEEGNHLRARLSNLVALLRARLALPALIISSPIIPIIMGSDHTAVDASTYLLEKGFLVQPIRPPTVREGTSRLRITLSSHHTEEQVFALADAITAFSPRPPSRAPILCPPPQAITKTSTSTPFPASSRLNHGGILLLGTDTGVGKTTVAVALLHILATRGIPPIPFKPVETGATPLPADASRLLAASQRRDISLDVVCPLPFPEPIAPAAAARNSPITLPGLLGHARKAASYGGPLVVESAGGLLTPYGHNLTSADLAAALHLPILLVARNGLGTINHTALAVAELRRRNLPLLGIVLVATTALPTPDQLSNSTLIAAATGIQPLGTLPFLQSQDPSQIAAAFAANVDISAILTLLATWPRPLHASGK
jgi:8-amino-7-oxononanoate synthase